ncbi:hypothetical protein B0H12DRAFT_393300 [Mycena haematopus]|nr:hypothetical protein B0H12DRAFT_393300 [Mycena haematopus]
MDLGHLSEIMHCLCRHLRPLCALSIWKRDEKRVETHRIPANERGGPNTPTITAVFFWIFYPFLSLLGFFSELDNKLDIYIPYPCTSRAHDRVFGDLSTPAANRPAGFL